MTTTQAQEVATTITSSEFWLSAQMTLETPEAAEALAAQFPKALRLQAGAAYGTPGREHSNPRGSVSFKVNMTPDANNGGVNEAGVRRFQSFVKACAKLGVTAQYDATAYSNSITAERLAEITGVTL